MSITVHQMCLIASATHAIAVCYNKPKGICQRILNTYVLFVIVYLEW